MLRFIFLSLFFSFIIYLVFRLVGGFIRFMGGNTGRSRSSRFNKNENRKAEKKAINPEDIVEAEFEEIETKKEQNQ
ncbi:MAG: hypothetical protein SCALA702_08240 [Melioribacteraceae bacterium]|nr:MAG: hypothetical protein SCALA702_08240 [Melioribacteraceae bacterium]